MQKIKDNDNECDCGIIDDNNNDIINNQQQQQI